jgi:hypothetical protein
VDRVTTPLPCPNCQAALPVPAAGEETNILCPACRRSVRLVVFPALLAPATNGAVPEPVVAEGEAACFYHPARRAVVPCESCGRFLCALCDLPVAGKHLCPSCLESGSQRGDVQTLERSRLRHDLIVWYLLIVPLVVFCLLFIAPVTSVIALIWAVAKRNAKPSLVDNTRIRLLGAMVFAVVALFGSTFFLLFAFSGGLD